jgi:hypothetical protein
LASLPGLAAQGQPGLVGHLVGVGCLPRRGQPGAARRAAAVLLGEVVGELGLLGEGLGVQAGHWRKLRAEVDALRKRAAR